MHWSDQYHKDGKVCLILGNLKFLGGGWGFGMVVTKNCPKTIFLCPEDCNFWGSSSSLFNSIF